MKKPSDFVKQGWCQGRPAQTINRMTVEPTDERAVYYCLYGAILAAFPDDQHQHQRQELINCLWNLPGGPYEPVWNDEPGRTKEEVVAILERAEQAIELNTEDPAS